MPTVALSMIVKNEEQMLQGCLESVRDFVDEMIVVDTGSTDNTRQIAIDAGAKVFDFDWIDDFSAARNFAKSHTNCDYVLSMDADERLVLNEPNQLQEVLEENTNSIIYLRLSPAISIDADLKKVISGEQSSGAVTFLPRILKNYEGNDWQGRIHEHPINTMDASYHLVDIVHLGADLEFRKIHQKSERNLRLLEKELKENPDQYPIFYSYLAGERESIGDLQGQKEALRMGWETTMKFLEERTEHQVASTGLIALYPAVLISTGEYVKGLKCLAELINNLQIFSGNPVNTLYEVIQTLFQVHIPNELQGTLYELVYDGADVVASFDDTCFPEPMIEGVCTYKAIQMKIVACLKLKRLEEAEELIKLLKNFSEVDLEVKLFELELKIEKGEVFEAMNEYPLLLQDNLQACPDIWILGSILLISLGQEEDSREFIQRAIELPVMRFLSRHRINLLKGLYVRDCLFKGTPIPGYGAYGVLGSLLSRQPIQCTAIIPSSLIEVVVEKYLELERFDILIRLFDERSEQILPGCGALVRKVLAKHGFDLQDDGKFTPIVIVTNKPDEIVWLFDQHQSCELHQFSNESFTLIEQELTEGLNSTIEDMLFGDDFFDEDDAENTEEGVLAKEVGGYTKPVVFAWSTSWPIEMLREIFPDSPVIVYVEDPSGSNDPSEFTSWNNNYKDRLMSLGTETNNNLCYITNAEALSVHTDSSLSGLFAWCGLNPLETNQGQDKTPDFDPDRLSKWCSDADQELMKIWGFFKG